MARTPAAIAKSVDRSAASSRARTRRGWFSDRGGRVDGIAGFELRAGRLRVRPTIRLTRGDLDTRIIFVY
jgi:hypothetical protein